MGNIQYLIHNHGLISTFSKIYDWHIYIYFFFQCTSNIPTLLYSPSCNILSLHFNKIHGRFKAENQDELIIIAPYWYCLVKLYYVVTIHDPYYPIKYLSVSSKGSSIEQLTKVPSLHKKLKFVGHSTPRTRLRPSR